MAVLAYREAVGGAKLRTEPDRPAGSISIKSPQTVNVKINKEKLSSAKKSINVMYDIRILRWKGPNATQRHF
jgi:hypothetical protein